MMRSLLAVSLGLAAVAACSDGGPSATGRVDVAAATNAAAVSGVTNGLMLAETYTDGSGNTLTFDSVLVVIRKLRLQNAAIAGCDVDDDDDGEGEDTSAVMMSHDSLHDEDEDDDEGCGQVRAGPFLVSLTLDSGAVHQFTVTVDTGTYTRAAFQLHKPTGSHDRALVMEHPEMEGVSIRVVGTYNGTGFVYTSRVTDVQRVDLDPPLVVGDGTASLTLRVDLSGWFKNGVGTLVDPATAVGDGVNVWLVRHNINRSFHGFRDEDHDGHGDDED